MRMIQYPQKNCLETIKNKIIALENIAWPQDVIDTTFPSAPETYVTSFVLMEKDMAVCHVGVRTRVLHHTGEDYLAYGLSEVVTRPQYRKKGLAFQAIETAVRFIIAQQPDIGIFTCARESVALYTRCGWEAIPGACFVGGASEKPFCSDSLKLVTMMMFLSAKGKQHRKDFENADIIVELGENQLW